MKKTIIVLSLLLFMSACVSNSNKTGYKKITAEQAEEMMDSEEDIVVLDARTLSEYNAGHIKNAVLIPDTDIKDKAQAILTDKNVKILVYCRTGRRSKLASDELIRMGYMNVYDFGGIVDWKYDIVVE